MKNETEIMDEFRKLFKSYIEFHQKDESLLIINKYGWKIDLSGYLANLFIQIEDIIKEVKE